MLTITDLFCGAGGTAWLERHDLLRHLATPPAVFRAVARDVTADKLHGRRERFDPSVPPGGWVCAEPDPDRPDGQCELSVGDQPCGVHHPAAPEPGQFCHVHFSWLCQAGQGQCHPVKPRP